jgi:hypothetical protein
MVSWAGIKTRFSPFHMIAAGFQSVAVVANASNGELLAAANAHRVIHRQWSLLDDFRFFRYNVFAVIY